MDGEIDPEALRDALEDGDDGTEGGADDPLVVDIRPPETFAEGHLPGSLNVPLADLPGEIERIAEADHVVTVCPHGLASVKAARIVGAYREFDGRVESLAGGLEAWDGPLEAEEGERRADGTDGHGSANDATGDAPF